MKNKIIISLVGALLAFSAFLMGKVNQPKLAGVGDFGVRSCNIVTSTIMVVGKDIPTTLAATSSSRARLLVEQTLNATTTLAFAFNGANATTGTNLLINGVGYSELAGWSRSATGTPVFKAGLATDNPYVGAVSAISLEGTSTALVTDCKY